MACVSGISAFCLSLFASPQSLLLYSRRLMSSCPLPHSMRFHSSSCPCSLFSPRSSFRRRSYTLRFSYFSFPLSHSVPPPAVSALCVDLLVSPAHHGFVVLVLPVFSGLALSVFSVLVLLVLFSAPLLLCVAVVLLCPSSCVLSPLPSDVFALPVLRIVLGRILRCVHLGTCVFWV